MISRRALLGGAGWLALSVSLGVWTSPAAALVAEDLTLPIAGVLNGDQSERFRAWMAFIVAEQIRRGPSPRWFHRDCAGLARFAVAEALRPHDERWRRANGYLGRRLPAEIGLTPDQAPLAEGWQTLSGDRQAFVTALAMVHGNSRQLGSEVALARPGDLMFFDQGDDQHLMIWMGNWIAYHTGQAAPVATGQTLEPSQDNGLRAVTLAQLLQWKDTRWRPREDNPNFAGFYRLAFLSR